MKTFHIFNFHHLDIENAISSPTPFDETTFEHKEKRYGVIIQEPYSCFNNLFSYYFHHGMSPKLQKEVKKELKNRTLEAFLEWFSSLHYLPLINPQTFQLDMRKRVTVAIENLETLDYIIPYESKDDFIEYVAPELVIKEAHKDSSLFSIETLKKSDAIESFIKKDKLLYETAIALWKQSKANHFTPMHLLLAKKKQTKKQTIKEEKANYEGVVDTINASTISGWVYHKESYEPLSIGLYQNNRLIQSVETNIFRAGVKKNKNHPTGLCGFTFSLQDKPLQPKDTLTIEVIPQRVAIKLSQNAKAFFRTPSLR